jgi:uncharacterized oxidoreductase
MRLDWQIDAWVWYDACRFTEGRTVNVPTIQADRLEDIARQIFIGVGSPDATAKAVAGHLVDANLTGHDSHGAIRIIQYVANVKEGKLSPDGTPEIVKETPTIAHIDGHGTFGQVVGNFAAQKAIEKAKVPSISCVALYNQGHLGRIGAYPEICANAGMACIMFCGLVGEFNRVVPFGGKDGRLSTNPIAMACPSDLDGPILLDFATCVAAEGKIRVYRARGNELPEGWIIDKDGNASTDPNDLYDGGCIMPIGGSVGHKGYALSFLMGILGGALSGAGFVEGVPASGGLLVTIDPQAFVAQDQLNARVNRFTEYVTSSPPAEGIDKVLYPGQKEAITRSKRLASGIDIEEATWEGIVSIANDLGVQSHV